MTADKPRLLTAEEIDNIPRRHDALLALHERNSLLRMARAMAVMEANRWNIEKRLGSWRVRESSGGPYLSSGHASPVEAVEDAEATR